MSLPDKTIIDFESDLDIWPIVVNWAQGNKLKKISINDTFHSYKLKHNLFINIYKKEKKIRIEAWSPKPPAGYFILSLLFFWTAFFYLLVIRKDVGIEKGGIYMSYLRKKARVALNNLFRRLNQESMLIT